MNSLGVALLIIGNFVGVLFIVWITCAVAVGAADEAKRQRAAITQQSLNRIERVTRNSTSEIQQLTSEYMQDLYYVAKRAAEAKVNKTISNTTERR